MSHRRTMEIPPSYVAALQRVATNDDSAQIFDLARRVSARETYPCEERAAGRSPVKTAALQRVAVDGGMPENASKTKHDRPAART